MTLGVKSLYFSRTAASEVPAFIIGAAGRGGYRNRFIIAKDNLNVNSLERKWSPDRPRGEKSRKNQYLPELRANKSVQPPTYEYSTIFQNDRQIFPGFLPLKKGLWRRNCAGTKKFPQHFSQKFLIFLTLLP